MLIQNNTRVLVQCSVVKLRYGDDNVAALGMPQIWQHTKSSSNYYYCPCEYNAVAQSEGKHACSRGHDNTGSQQQQ